MICIKKIQSFHGQNHQIIEKVEISCLWRTDGRTEKSGIRAVFWLTRKRNYLEVVYCQLDVMIAWHFDVPFAQ